MEDKSSKHWSERIDRREVDAEQCRAEKWERRKRLVDALIGYVERVSGNPGATPSELGALPGVAEVCSRFL